MYLVLFDLHFQSIVLIYKQNNAQIQYANS